MKVHIQYGPKPEHLAVLRERLHPEIQLTVGDVPPRPADFEILVHGFPSRADVTASPKLRALIVPWAGAPIETLDLMQTFPGIPVHSIHYNVGPTAEMAIALFLAAAPSSFPFQDLDNVVMSPHRAGWSNETEIARSVHLAALLNAAARGEPMPHRIDTHAGY